VEQQGSSIAVVPYMSTGATDSARLRAWGIQTYGVLPFPLAPEDEGRMHGTDERVPIESLLFGTDFGVVSAVGVFYLVPSLVMYIAAQKYLLQMSVGGIKG
jgi:hypothetical protein